MIDKMIHAQEFRLRVLLTNKCNKNCEFCLNDFQPKTPTSFANPFDLTDCIRAYGQFMRSIQQPSIVTFSGGEPGIYPFLYLILRHARHYCDCVKVATNGTALDEENIHYVDKWHCHPTDKDERILEFNHIIGQEFNHIAGRVAVQIVVTDQMDDLHLLDLVDYYRDAGIPIKLFADFNSPNRLGLFDRIRLLGVQYPDIETRFSGKQINRGAACTGCEKDCVTLKALWYFPDGTSSTCPQMQRPLYDDDSWDETVEKAYKEHQVK